MLPRDFDELTPADWAEYQRGLRDRRDDAWEMAAWVALQCINRVSRAMRSPISLATMIPGVWARRERRRAAAEAAIERENAERRRLGLPPFSADEED